MPEGLRLFRLRAFTVLWLATLASSAGLWMERLITTWLALELGGPTAVATNLAARLVPFLLLGMVAGTIADRYPRRLVLVAVAALSALASGGIAIRLLAGGATAGDLAIVALLAGIANVFDMSARGAIAVDIAGRQNAGPAIAINAVGTRLFSAVGSLGGGIALPLLGPSAGYVITAAIHIVGLVLVLCLDVADRGETGVAGRGERFWPMLGGTVRLIATNPAVRMVVIASLACETFGFSHQAALPALARDVLRIGAEGLGALTAASSIGATISVIGLSFLSPFARRQPLLAATLMIWGAALVALALAGSVPLALVCMLVIGACASAVDVLQQTIAQMSVPEDERGRAAGVWAFSIGMNVLGLTQVGLVVATFGPAISLGANGTGAILSALLIALLNPVYRWRRAEAHST